MANSDVPLMSVEMRRNHRGGDSRQSLDVCRNAVGTLLTGNSRHVHVLRIRNAEAKEGGAWHSVVLSCRIIAHVIVSPRSSKVVPGMYTRMDERN